MSERESRAVGVAEAVHSAHLEGGDVTPAFLADARDYIEERISIRELLNRTRNRYGLETV
ncbi:antitoxin VbhA family protein [Bifidobacterium amazonense]|uniref:Antitoxin VbhA family protein n=1 Tax=Bifidobacterium amazonense TaxID=2809027 RepID=A0ABS9VYP1_9BIFI|nr:antitoxin VbhA family protein [Bifidobacterium amazonense]MCH9277223.1 antitoxin VbhA family protein [Bifidobacterium amazonense]